MNPDTHPSGIITIRDSLPLKATFSGADDNTNSMTGTIDNFKLNDGSENPGWSIALEKAAWDSTEGEFVHAPAGSGTIWSIGDSEGNESGEWQAQLYKTNATNPTIPDTVAGTFYSWIGSTHELQGAFGATHQPSE